MTGLDETLPDDLEPRQGAHMLVQLLEKRARLPMATIARACGVRPATVRHWSLMNRRPTADGYERLRYLADVVAVLAGTCTPRGVNQWLTGPNRQLGDAPLSVLATGDPDRRVLDAAEWLAGDGVA